MRAAAETIRAVAELRRVLWRAKPQRAVAMVTTHHPSPVAPHTASDVINQARSTNTDATSVQVKPYGGNLCSTRKDVHAAGNSQILNREGTIDVIAAASAHRMPRNAPMPTRQPTAKTPGRPP